MNILRQFYENTGERDAVKAFLTDVLKEIAVERTFNGEDVGGIKDAKDCVEKAFDRLEELYGIKKKATITDSR